MTSFLQSAAWRRFQEKLGRTVVSDSGDGWSYQGYIETGVGNRRIYVPHGPVCASDAAFSAALDSLKSAAAEHRVDFVRLDPRGEVSERIINQHHLKSVNYQSLEPSRTRMIDLSPAPDELLAQMSQPSRNLTRNFENKGVRVRISHDPADIDILIGLLNKVLARNHVAPHHAEYYRQQAETLLPSGDATLYIAEFKDQAIAAALFFDSVSTRTYAHAAANDEFRRLNAGTAIVGRAILDAKAKNLAYFDLNGIAPDNQPNHPWAGFSRFKASFGGDPVDFLGSFDLPIHKLRYWFYRTYHSLRHSLRK